MKAQVIKTGEVVEVVQDFGYFLEVSLNPEQSQRLWKPDELDLDYEHWIAFRREAAKDVLPAVIAKKSSLCNYDEVVKEAIKFADELIRQLKKEQK